MSSKNTSLFAGAILATFLTGPLQAGDKIEYNRDIRPILAENCFSCHGPDSAARKADLRFDRREVAISVVRSVLNESTTTTSSAHSTLETAAAIFSASL